MNLPKNLINMNPIIFLCILLISNTILTVVGQTNECPGCLCIPSIAYLDMQCPGPPEYPKIHANIQTGKISTDKSASIECDGLQANEYILLPNMNIGPTQTVALKKCPLPLGTPLNNIIKRLGITNVQVLFFDRGHDEKMQSIHLKGLNDLRRLRLSGIDFSEMPDDIFSEVKNLKWLDLRSNKINLPNNIFGPLENLEYLELGHNKLQDLLPGTFRNQKRLVDLNLWGNNLTNLTKSAFEDATSITDLDLSSNNIERLREDLFVHLKNLTNINLSGNHIKELPQKLFSTNKKLALLRLTNNRVPLREIPDRFAADLNNLKSFALTCELRILPANLFSGSNNLETLSLFSNKLEKIPIGFLDNQKKLLSLDLSRNLISELDDNLLAHTESLVDLSLAYNQLVNISGEFFRSLKNLKNLKLNNNHLKTLPADTFKYFTPNLNTIELQNNELNFITHDIPNFVIVSPLNGLQQLTEINLSNNSIDQIFPDWMLDLLHLQKLDLSYNNITRLTKDDLQFLSKDVTLNLNNNQISLINFIYIELLDVKGQRIQLSIENNPISCDCDILNFIQFLRGHLASHLRPVFEIDTENLYCHGPAKLNGTELTRVDTRDLLCPIEDSNAEQTICPTMCECWARPIDVTLIVNCTNRQLTEVPLLPRLTYLNFIELHIENNMIKNLPALNYGGYANVTEIHARFNKISNINPENIPKNLKLLDLSQNKLKAVNASLMTELSKVKGLRHMYLGHNPWKCDCTLPELLTFVKTNYKKITDLTQMKCETGESLASVNPNDVCPRDALIIIGCILIALFGLCLGILAALYYKYQLEIKVWLYAHNMCLWFVTEEELDKDKKYDAFVSYSSKDEEFITEFLVPELENETNGFKLCLHYRNWVGGEFIPDQIAKSVEESRRTIVVLSANFLESIWGRMEFRAAHQSALAEGRARVIIIIYGDIGDIELLDSELKAYLKMNTYVKWGDPWFWNKLRYALPHPKHSIYGSGNRTNGLIKSAMKGSIDDRLELIKPIPVTPPLTTPPAEQASKNPLLAKLNGDIKTSTTTTMTSQQQNGYHNNHQQQNGKLMNGINGHVNGAFIINTNAKQSDV